MSDRSPEVLDRRDEGGSPYRRRGPGARIAKRHQIARQRRKRIFGVATIVWIVIGGLIVAGLLFFQTTRPNRQDAAPGEDATEPTQRTWLVMGTRESEPELGASWLSVFSEDRESNEASIIYVPPTTYVEIPGFGQEVIGRALALGREPLQVSAASNMLEVQFDHFVKISDQSIQAFVEKIGGVTLEVTAPLTVEEAGRVKTVFAQGLQNLNGQRAAEYLRFVDSGGDEISRGARHAGFWAGTFDKFRGEARGQEFEKIVGESVDLLETDAFKEELTSFLGRFVELGDEKLAFETLPVQSTGLDTGTQYYRAERDAVERMVKRYLSGSRPAGAGAGGRRVEILNGNGEPGVGQKVGDQLVPKGFRVVLNQNAKHFNYDVTQIVVYSNSKTALALAKEVQEVLGVGEVVISKQRQTLVDVTIVVGKDYLKTG